MGIRTAVVAGAALLLSGLAAQALESNAKAQSKLSADALWAKIGDFCGIANGTPHSKNASFQPTARHAHCR
jgi:hypothetical protein